MISLTLPKLTLHAPLNRLTIIQIPAGPAFDTSILTARVTERNRPSTMASRILLTPLANRGPLFLGLGAATALFCSPLRRSQILRADSGIAAASSPKDWSFSQYQHDASTPVVKRDGGLNPRAIKQISQGSILGVLGGLAVSMFSKSLAVLLGLLICGVQVRDQTCPDTKELRGLTGLHTVHRVKRHTHHTLRPTTKVFHQHRSALSGSGQRRVQAVVRSDLCARRLCGFLVINGRNMYRDKDVMWLNTARIPFPTTSSFSRLR